MNKIKFLPPQILLAFIIGAVLTDLIFPIKQIIFFPLNMLGFVVFLLSIVLCLWVDNLFKKHHTTIRPFEDPDVFITEGPFQISRHPMYLSFVLLLFGLALMLGSATPFIFPLLIFLIFEIRYLPAEEKNMKKKFGKDYQEYKKRVGKWLSVFK